MRKITRLVCGAFLKGESLRVGNTRTDGKAIYLHGNLIAKWSDWAHGVCITSAGWPTRTTADKLNGLLELAGTDWRIIKRGDTLRAIHPINSGFTLYSDSRSSLIPLYQLSNPYLPPQQLCKRCRKLKEHTQ